MFIENAPNCSKKLSGTSTPPVLGSVLLGVWPVLGSLTRRGKGSESANLGRLTIYVDVVVVPFFKKMKGFLGATKFIISFVSNDLF